MWWTRPRSVARPRRIRRAVFVREDGDQAPVARVEVEVLSDGVVEVRLLEDERHPEDAFPEVDRRLAIGADQRDVVDPLALQLPHQRSISLDLYSLRCKLPHGTSSTAACTISTSRSSVPDCVGELRVGVASCDSSTATGSGGSCLTPAALGLTRTRPLTTGTKLFTTSRTADGNTFTPRTISMSSVRPRQRTRGVVLPHAHGPVQTSTWSRVRKRSSGAASWSRCVSTARRSRRPPAPGRCLCRIDQLRVDKARGAQVHPGLLLAFAPQGRADVSDPHRLGHARPPALLELGPERGSPPPGSPATRIRCTLESRRSASSSR